MIRTAELSRKPETTSNLCGKEWRRKVPKKGGRAHKHVIYVPSLKNQYKRVVFGKCQIIICGIQVENKNVGLKVCVCVCGGGGGAQTYHCPPINTPVLSAYSGICASFFR